MKKLFSLFTAFAVLTFFAIPALAEVNSITPSTNDINRTNGWAHVDQLSKDVGTMDLKFISTRTFWSCFEYRIDNESNTVVGSNPNPLITDGRWTQICVNNSESTKTILADEYVDVRMVYGAETDERFDWTRFYVKVLPTTPVIEGFHNPELSCGAITNAKMVTVDWTDSTVTDGTIDSYEYWVNYPKTDGTRADWKTTFATSQYRGSLNEGLHIVRVRAKDNSGNYSEWSNECSITADWTSPDITFSGFRDQSSAVYDNTPIINSCGSINTSGFIAWEWLLNKTEANPVSYLYKILSGPTATGYSAITSNTHYNGQIPMVGTYQVEVTGTDTAGNVGIPQICSVTYQLPVADLCSNIGGVQNPIPSEYRGNPDGTCTLIVGPPADKDLCKKDGWKKFNNPTFKNQGECVSYVQSNEKAGKR